MSTENSLLVEEKKDISAQVLNKITTFEKAGELKLPKDYSVENALKSAYIILSDPKNNILEKCDKSSVAEALLKMVVNGVSPIKKQCYFIPYGNKLECSISYAGNVVIAKRYGNLKRIKANAIYEGDIFEFEIDQSSGRRKIIKHSQTLESIGSNKVIGAYAVCELNDNTVDVEIMSINQIQQAWAQGGSKGNSPAHKNFMDEMAKKTVINRACKLLISSSSDAVLFDSIEEERAINVMEENVAYEIAENANKQELGFSEEKQPLEKVKPAEAFEREYVEVEVVENVPTQGPGF